jgi:protein tyrosine phosphatase (PTP) superfamily phosphohydrolase (DUF442 family)
MSRIVFLLLPALMIQVQAAEIPGAVEVRPGVFVLRGLPSDETCVAIKRFKITHVVDLRRDGEPNLDCESESTRLQELGVQYMRYAVGKTPPAADFEFLRTFLNELPRGSKVLFHCSNGNRAAAVVCPWLVLDKGMSLEEALKVARSAGLKLPETEEAMRSYLRSKGRA